MSRKGELSKYEGAEREYCVPDGTCRIGDLAFAGADSLEKLIIPDSVRELGNYSFMNCYALREIRMPGMVESIGAGLFQNCWQLRSIRIPEGTLTLGTDMFENCHALTEIWLPLTLQEAARTALSGCRNLRTIHISSGQIGLLPPSARYTAVLTFMEEHASREPESDEADVIGKYVRGRQRSFLDLAINRKSTDAVRYMLTRRLIDEEAVREYMSRSAGSGRVEITALFLESLKDAGTPSGLAEDPFL